MSKQNPKKAQSAKLYLVATPIGNLEDITLRALKTLKQASIILSERPKTTLKLLSKYNIKPKRLITYREDNHNLVAPQIIEWLKQGKSVALVSEAGTPVLSDPGLKLVKDIYKTLGPNYIEVIPGASAATTAVAGFPIPTFRFLFLGFINPKRLKNLLSCQTITVFKENYISLVLFQAPTKLESTLKLLQKIEQECNVRIMVGVARELTKIHEQRIVMPLHELLKDFNKVTLKGEFTLVLWFI